MPPHERSPSADSPAIDRPDLGAIFFHLSRGIIAAEQPILDRHGLSMWGYAVLTALADGPAPTQLELARAIGADKTRLISHLDRLEEHGLVERAPDPTDRRAHLVSLTKQGRRRYEAAVRDIRKLEERLLSVLDPKERVVLERALPRLLGEPIESLREAHAAND